MEEKVRVLIVDDDPAILEIIEDILLDCANSRIVTITHTSSADAEKEIINKNVDILLTDMVMDNLSGNQLIDLVNKEAPWTKIIGITGDHKLDTMLSLMNLGVDAYISKPFSYAEIIEVFEPCVQLIEGWKFLIQDELSKRAGCAI